MYGCHTVGYLQSILENTSLIKSRVLILQFASKLIFISLLISLEEKD
jgi:hypothetical protein